MYHGCEFVWCFTYMSREFFVCSCIWTTLFFETFDCFSMVAGVVDRFGSRRIGHGNCCFLPMFEDSILL